MDIYELQRGIGMPEALHVQMEKRQTNNRLFKQKSGRRTVRSESRHANIGVFRKPTRRIVRGTVPKNPSRKSATHISVELQDQSG